MRGNPNYFAGIDVKQIEGPKNKIDGQITEECFTENIEIKYVCPKLDKNVNNIPAESHWLFLYIKLRICFF